MDKIYAEDFNYRQTESYGTLVKLSELNKMIEYGAITVDKQKLKEYKFDTTVLYNKDKMSREEAMKLWGCQ